MKHGTLVLVSQDPGGERPWRSRSGGKAQGRVAVGTGARALPGFGRLAGVGVQAVGVPGHAVVIMDACSPGE